MSNEPSELSVGEDAARLILARAAELDAARGVEVDIAAVRAAAIDAGISPAAFERALAEVRAQRVKTSDPAAAGGSGWVSKVQRGAIFAAGLAMGAIAVGLWRGVGVDAVAAVSLSLVMAALTTIVLMMRRRRDRAVLDFEIDLGLLWVGLTFALMLGAPTDGEEVLAAMVPIGSIAALLGGAYVALPQREKMKELPEETGA